MIDPIPAAELARRAKEGDQQAIRGLVGLFSSRLEGFVRSRMGERLKKQLEIDDVVQETFAKAFTSIKKLEWQGESAFFSWLATIADNVILSASQKTERMPLLLDLDVANSAASPSKDLRRDERFDRFQEALRELSPDYRQVIVLARIQRLKIEEIADRMQRSPNAVKKLLGRALKELKRGFGDTESLHLPERELDLRGTDDEQ